MDTLTVIFVTHPSFAEFGKEEHLLLCNYFQSKRRSDGGSVDKDKLVVEEDGKAMGSLIQFADPSVVERVCARSHCLSMVFSTRPELVPSVDQNLIIQAYSALSLEKPNEAAVGQSRGDDTLTSSLYSIVQKGQSEPNLRSPAEFEQPNEGSADDSLPRAEDALARPEALLADALFYTNAQSSAPEKSNTESKNEASDDFKNRTSLNGVGVSSKPTADQLQTKGSVAGLTTNTSLTGVGSSKSTDSQSQAGGASPVDQARRAGAPPHPFTGDPSMTGKSGFRADKLQSSNRLLKENDTSSRSDQMQTPRSLVDIQTINNVYQGSKTLPLLSDKFNPPPTPLSPALQGKTLPGGGVSDFADHNLQTKGVLTGSTSGSAALASDASPSANILLKSNSMTRSATPGAATCQLPTKRVEVYEYPADCVDTELHDYFNEPPLNARCVTPLGEAWNEETKMFILEFTDSDAEKILTQTAYYLDKYDKDTKILVRMFVVPTRQLLVTSNQDINTRVLKKHFRQFGDVETYEKLNGSKRHFILTFVNAKDAKGVAAERKLPLGNTLSVTVQLYRVGEENTREDELASSATAGQDSEVQAEPTLAAADSKITPGKNPSPSCKIEVYDYPEDCLEAELRDHFGDSPYNATCATPQGQMWNEETKTWVLEFAESDVERILRQSEQYLEKGEEDSKISVRRFVPPTRQVLVTSDQDLNVRFLRKHIKQSVGDVEQCLQVPGNRRLYVVTFNSSKDAEVLAAEKTLPLGNGLAVSVQLFGEEDCPKLLLSAGIAATSKAAPSVTVSADLTATSQNLYTEAEQLAPKCTVEIYHYPDDCLETELRTYFSDPPFLATCGTLPGQMWSEETKTFILEFTEFDATRILSHSQLLLDEDDADSTILVRMYVEATKQILVISDFDVNIRLLRKYLSKFGEVEAYNSVEGSKKRFIVTFKDAKDAKGLAEKETVVLSGELIVTVQLYREEENPAPLLSHSDIASQDRTGSIDTRSDLHMPDSLQTLAAAVRKQLPTAGATKIQSDQAEDTPAIPASLPSGTESGADEAAAVYTHVEVDILPHYDPKYMYHMLLEHLGVNEEAMKFEHSYDGARELLRIDLQSQDIRRLMSRRQLLAKDDEATALEFRPKQTGKVVRVSVVKNPNKASLRKNHLKKWFGGRSAYNSLLDIRRHDSDSADLEMETSSVAALIVSIGTHTLENNIVVQADYLSPAKAAMEPVQDAANEQRSAEIAAQRPAEAAGFTVVLTESRISRDVLKMFMKTKTKGKMIKQIGEDKYLIQYDNSEDAIKVVKQETLTYKDSVVSVRFYTPDLYEESIVEAGPQTQEDGFTVSQPTHIEVYQQPHFSSSDMFAMLELYLEDILGADWTPTIYEHSYDEVKRVFRFDMKPENIGQILSCKQLLDDEEEHSWLFIESKNTGQLVYLKSSIPGDRTLLSVADLNNAFGPKSKFVSKQIKAHSTAEGAVLELESCSVASRIVSLREHKLKDGLVVVASFPDQLDNRADRFTSREDTAKAQAGGADNRTAVTRSRDHPVDVRHGPSALADIHSSQGPPIIAQHTVQVSKLLDADNQTVYFWFKALTGVWPTSVQIAREEEKAIVKFPALSKIAQLKHNRSIPDFYLFGEKLSLVNIDPTAKIQVICYSSKPITTDIYKAAVDSYFHNRKGRNALLRVDHCPSHSDGKVFILTYGSEQDVSRVLQHGPHKHGEIEFDVAEFYEDIGLCDKGSLVSYSSPLEEDEEASLTPAIYVKDVPSADLPALKTFMGDKRSSGGSTIAKLSRVAGDEELVKIVYRDPKLAERLYYGRYQRSGLSFNGKPLEIELELPWLTDRDDKHKVRLAGLDNKIEPEKLKFYLSAISDNVISQIFFNQQQTRAVVEFRQPIDFSQLRRRHHAAAIDDCQRLRIRPEPLPCELLAVGNLSKVDIELSLEKVLESKFGRDVEVLAEEIPGAADMWKITLDAEAAKIASKYKDKIPGCSSLSLFSGYLGLKTISGVYKKTRNLSEYISDPLILEFFNDKSQHGFNHLAKHFKGLGFLLAKDGTVTVDSAADKKKSRMLLRSRDILIKEAAEGFIKQFCATYSTDVLTEQVFTKVSQKIQSLAKKQPVVLEIVDGGKDLQSSGTRITVAGERDAVESLKAELEKAIRKANNEIWNGNKITKITIPNIREFQTRYLLTVRFLDPQSRKLTSISQDFAKQTVTLEGLPADIDAVQREMLSLLPMITRSRVFVNKNSLFLRVFKTDFAEKSINQKFLAERVRAVWIVENKTISVYSETRGEAQKALGIITEMVWESEYPADQEFDELERKVLSTGDWADKKKTLQQSYQPLVIKEFVDNSRVRLVGLAHQKASVLEEIPYFFSQTVLRVKDYNGDPDRVSFLCKFLETSFQQLEKDHHVTIKMLDNKTAVQIIGTVDYIANTERSLKMLVEAVRKENYIVENQAMMHHVHQTPRFLERVGSTTKCLVVLHKDTVQETVGPQSNHSQLTYSVRLPSGVTCSVQRGNITAFSCDAIVNAANGDMQHVGGLAYAIIQAGGNNIQQECTDHVRRHGSLMEGEVMSSSPGRLPCKRIIHAVGPRWCQGKSGEEISLFNCIDNCFEEAAKHQIQSIAIPPISTGIFGYPLKQAVKIMVDVIANRVTQKETLPQQIVFIDNKDDSLRLFKATLEARYGPAEPSAAVAAPAAPATPAASTLPAQTPAPAAVHSPPRKKYSMAPIDPRTHSSVPKSKFSINGNKIHILNRVVLEIVKGDIIMSQEQSLVVSVGRDFELRNGKVSAAVSTKAGSELQSACYKLGRIRDGDVKQTDGFKLHSAKVLHCCCPSYSGSQAVQVLADIVTKCLEMTASNRHASIALPALGTGNLGYPEKEVARAMIEKVIEYAEKNPMSSVTDIKIVIFHMDQKTQKGFDAEIARLSALASGSAVPNTDEDRAGRVRRRSERGEDSVRPAGPSARPPQSPVVEGRVTINNTAIQVVHGDLTAHRARALVNSTDGKLTVIGQLSEALINKAGDAVAREIRGIRPTDLREGIRVTSAGNLNADKIIHVDAELGRRGSDGWSRIITECLRTCDMQKLISIGFPPLGTGAGGVSAKKMGKIILQSAVRYIKENRRTCLVRIDVVVYQESMVKDFKDSMSEAVDEKQSTWGSWARTIIPDFIVSRIAGPTTSDRGEISALDPIQPATVLPIPLSTEEKEVTSMLDIYGRSVYDVRACRDMLDLELGKVMHILMWRNKKSYADDREFLKNLTAQQVRTLQDEARKLSVKLEINQSVPDVKIEGLNRNVYLLSDKVAAELRRVEKEFQEKKEAEDLAAIVQWEYKKKFHGPWKKFVPKINKQLEETYKKDAGAQLSLDTGEGVMTVNIGKQEGRNKYGDVFQIQRQDHSRHRDTTEDGLMSTWTSPLDYYHEVPLVPGTTEYVAVETEFMKTLTGGYNRILEIKRVQDALLYQRYRTLRSEVAQRLNKREDQVETTPLWHGTSEDRGTKLTLTKPDRGMSGQNATMLGKRFCFAKNSSHAAQHQYAAPNSRGEKYILQTRVITGDWYLGSESTPEAPYKSYSPLEQYDSVVDNLAFPTYFVVFHEFAAYPEYIITFK